MKKLATKTTATGLIKISGNDAAKFLQGQLTCDIKELNKQQALPGAYCTPKGRIRTNFIILQQDVEQFLMILPESQVSFLLDALNPFLAFFQCTIEDITGQWHISGLQITGEATSLQMNESLLLEKGPWIVSSNSELICINLPGKYNLWLCLSRNAINDITADFVPLDEISWQSQEIFSGLVWIDEPNREKFLPHDISLPDLGAVSFSKGCYVGQEIVARMEYRGKPKYVLAILKTEPMTEKPKEQLIQLINDEESSKVGDTISMLQLEDRSWLICCSLKRALLNQQKIELSSGVKKIICTIIIPDLNKKSKNT